MANNLLYKLKSGTEGENFGRDIVVRFAEDYIKAKKSSGGIKVLDIGAGHGDDLLNIQNNAKARLELLAIENYRPYIKELISLGIEVISQNLETDRYQLGDKSVDIIVANQVLEHTKEIFWIMSEFGRVLKPGGRLIIGVPNLASWHNRLALLFGKQPPVIATFGPHVRGFTYRSFKEFIEQEAYFKVVDRAGANFYPFRGDFAKWLAKAMPGGAVGMFLSVERTDKDGSFVEILDHNFFETPYYRGPNN